MCHKGRKQIVPYLCYLKGIAIQVHMRDKDTSIERLKEEISDLKIQMKNKL